MKKRNNIFNILLTVIVGYLLFRHVLKLQHLDAYLFILYFCLFALSIGGLNYFLKKNYFRNLLDFLRKGENNLGFAIIIITVIHFVLFFALSFSIKCIDSFTHVNWILTEVSFNGNLRAVLNFTVVSSVLISFYFYTKFSSLLKDKQLHDQKAITGNVSAQFESLKNQLDPHFLFNSLNVLEALIEEDKDKAVAFNHSLSKTYRYILDQKNKELVPLEEELAFAKTYIELLQMRFEDSLQFKLPDRVNQEGAKVVPLSLQLLLENVIKHNKATANRPIYIEITERADGYLEIKNTLNKKQTTETRKGIGLDNITSRYALLTNKPISIEETEGFFTVKIPILTKIIEHMRIIDVPENEQDLLVEAKKNVEKIKKFYGHLTSYIMVNTFLIVLNVMTNPSFLWCLIPLFAWGIGLVSDGMKTFNYSLFLGKDWEDKKIREYMSKYKDDTQKWN